MTRIRKSPEERRQEIMEAAFKMFASKGYDKTDVSSICREIGIAKSTYFYHFSTKETVMESILQKFANDFVAALREKCDGKTALEQLQLFLDAINQELPVECMLDQIETPSDYKYFEYMWEKMLVEDLEPVLQAMFSLGIEEGSLHFSAEEIPERLRFLWSLADYLWQVPENMTSDDISDKEMDIRYKIVSSQLNTLLGIKPGLLRLSMP
ncbi:Transcriptional regulator, TetR family [Anaerovibrio sp. JC8]|uniref:TetR/AcrR family transcriptional regulator n=1 Tax=Anaerovibrio sp. JC8 TaxID=1240085 RepID=UPI000A0A9F14|nr:TetR/AcrR family transcriptional regulator [Anaerovibrio sp. JC8]ORT99590.1 Transcriptional regulator, TetR family [Anaerovibrio sp. JC8]